MARLPPGCHVGGLANRLARWRGASPVVWRPGHNSGDVVSSRSPPQFSGGVTRVVEPGRGPESTPPRGEGSPVAAVRTTPAEPLLRPLARRRALQTSRARRPLRLLRGPRIARSRRRCTPSARGSTAVHEGGQVIVRRRVEQMIQRLYDSRIIPRRADGALVRRNQSSRGRNP